MGILAHGTIDKLDLAACLFQFLDQEHLVDIGASQAIWGCDDYPIKGGTSDLIPQSVQSWATQTRGTLAIIAKNVFILPLPSVRLAMSPQEVSLLLNSLRLRLPLRRHTHIDCDFHCCSPVECALEEPLSGTLHSSVSGAGTPDPTAAARRQLLSCDTGH